VETEKTEFPLHDITLDQRLQPRAVLDAETVEDYAARYAEDADMPAVTLFHDGDTYWLADGFHRASGAEKAGRENILATVRVGTFHDALLFAAAANASHGLRRTNADKRRSVTMLLADPECAGWSDSEIGKHCSVDHKTVAAVRVGILGNSQDADSAHADLGKSQDAPGAHTITVTRNGVSYKMNTAKIGKCRTAPQEAASTVPRLSLDDMPETNESGLLACPFCGTPDVDLVRPPEGWQVKCPTPNCGISGPRSPDVMEVQDAWNRREGPGKYEAAFSSYQ